MAQYVKRQVVLLCIWQKNCAASCIFSSDYSLIYSSFLHRIYMVSNFEMPWMRNLGYYYCTTYSWLFYASKLWTCQYVQSYYENYWINHWELTCRSKRLRWNYRVFKVWKHLYFCRAFVHSNFCFNFGLHERCYFGWKLSIRKKKEWKRKWQEIILDGS